MCVLALLLASPVWADEPPQDPNDWECDTPSAPLYPRNFIGELYDELLKGHPFSDEENALFLDGQAHNALDRLQLRDDFQQRWLEWLAGRGLPSDWKCGDPRGGDVLGAAQIPAVNLDTGIISAEAAAAGTGIKSNVQHSIAKNIPKKRTVQVHVYGDASCTRCDTYVNLLWNGSPLSEFSTSRLKLTPFPGKLITLYLRASSTLLPAKTNRLTVTLLAGNNIPKVFVSADKPAEFFPGSQFVKPNNSYPLPFLTPVNINVALGLACVDETLYPESAKHIKAAQALGYSRIVSPDRGLKNVNSEKRRAENVEPWKLIAANAKEIATCTKDPVRNPPKPGKLPATCHVDEYPPAMFVENQLTTMGGRPSMRAIPGGDNTGSGAKIGSYATPYLDRDPTNINPVRHTADNLEIIVPEKSLEGKLYCKNAF